MAAYSLTWVVHQSDTNIVAYKFVVGVTAMTTLEIIFISLNVAIKNILMEL